MCASRGDLSAVFMPELSWVKFCFNLSVTGQSEDGADQDSPEEGTPASPRNKRRVGRPGRKRKQLLPVSTAITGWRQPFKASSGEQRRPVCSPPAAAGGLNTQAELLSTAQVSPIQTHTMLTANTTQTHTHTELSVFILFSVQQLVLFAFSA